MKQFILSVVCVFLLAFALVAADDLSGSEFVDASQSGNPGSTATYTITYDNAGATDMTVSSTSSTLSDGTHTITAPTISDVTVSAGSTAEVSFTVDIPSTTAGTYTGTITGTDGSSSIDLDYTLTVDSLDAFTTSASSVSMDLQSGTADTTTFTITNTGSTTLSTWSLSYESSDGDSGKALDNDDDETSVSLTGASSLSPDSTMTITVHADPDSEMDLGTYSGTISISGTGSSTASSTVSLELVIDTDICEDGKQGSDFDIDIRNPDSGDDFVPGDTLPIEVKVKNNANDDLDVIVEVTLYNLDTGNKETTEHVSGSINEDESETFDIDFDLPEDLSDKDDYRIYVQVHEDGNEDDSCNFDSVNIDLKRTSEDAIISEMVSPALGLVCGDDYTVYITTLSTGSDSIENVYLELQDGDLDVQKSSESFDLGDYNDDDNEERTTFEFTLPTDIEEGSYSLEAILYDDNGNSLDSSLLTVDVDSCSEADQASDLVLSISDDYTVKGDQLTLGMLVSNNGDTTATITITPSDVEWATLTGSEYLENLAAGDEEHAYLYFTLDSTKTGQHDLEITVTDDQGNTVTKTITVDFGEATSDDGTSFFSGIGTWLGDHAAGSFWIIVDVILVILALVFGRMLFSKK